jgi:hypothetical protein
MEIAPGYQKSRGLLRGLFACDLFTYSVSSVAVAADADAHAGSAEADTATLFTAEGLQLNGERTKSDIAGTFIVRVYLPIVRSWTHDNW